MRFLCLAAVYAVLLLPMVQHLTGLIGFIPPLRGSYATAPDTVITAQGWFDGRYQQQKEKFLRDSFGFRNLYVRVSNQVNFSLFNKANTVYVVVGDESYLYELGYFYAYYGRDFLGEKRLRELTATMKAAQDTMRRRGKLLLPVIAAGKASFYPEYIPRAYRDTPRVSNYIYLSELLKHQKVDHIDFNRYFVREKNRSPYPLYPQFGIHWSNYGALLAFDSIVGHVETRLGRDLPDLEFIKVNLSQELQHTDNDIIAAMNLLYWPRTFPMAYPEWKVHYDSLRHTKPKLLVIADSFWWYIYSTGVSGSVFSDNRFWFYNEGMYPESFTAPAFVKDADYKAAIRSADVILLLYTEATLSRFGDGFPEMLLEAYAMKEDTIFSN